MHNLLITSILALAALTAQAQPITLLSTNLTTPGQITLLFNPSTTTNIPPPTNPPPTNPIPPNPPDTNAVIVHNATELRAALAMGSVPGNTILIRGGTYAGTYSSRLNGTAQTPIVVRNWPGERVTIDGGNSNGADIFTVRGSYTWFIGLEVMSSSGVRYSSVPGSDPPGSGTGAIPMGEGFVSGNESTQVPGIKFINCVVHDTRQGFSIWMNAINCEVYDCLAYNIGWVSTDRGHGHGIYTQSAPTSTRSAIRDIEFGCMSHGFQAYGSENAPLNNIQLIQNFMAMCWDRPFIVGGGQIAQNPVLIYNLAWTSGGATQIGQSQPVKNCILSSNLFLYPPSGNGTCLRFRADLGTSTFAAYNGNTFLGDVVSPPSGGSGNTTISQLPNQLIVYPNIYQSKYGNIAFINQAGANSITINLSTLGFNTGDAFIFRDAEDYYGNPVTQGIYGGGFVTVPCIPRPATTPIGNIPAEFIPKTTEPSLYMFIVSNN